MGTSGFPQRETVDAAPGSSYTRAAPCARIKAAAPAVTVQPFALHLILLFYLFNGDFTTRGGLAKGSGGSGRCWVCFAMGKVGLGQNYGSKFFSVAIQSLCSKCRTCSCELGYRSAALVLENGSKAGRSAAYVCAQRWYDCQCVTRGGTAVPEPRVSSVTRNPVSGGAGGGTSVTRDVLDRTAPDQNKPGEVTNALTPKGVNRMAGRGAGAQIKGLSSEPASVRGSWGVTMASSAALPHRGRCTPSAWCVAAGAYRSSG